MLISRRQCRDARAAGGGDWLVALHVQEGRARPGMWEGRWGGGAALDVDGRSAPVVRAEFRRFSVAVGVAED